MSKAKSGGKSHNHPKEVSHLKPMRAADLEKMHAIVNNLGQQGGSTPPPSTPAPMQSPMPSGMPAGGVASGNDGF